MEIPKRDLDKADDDIIDIVASKSSELMSRWSRCWCPRRMVLVAKPSVTEVNDDGCLSDCSDRNYRLGREVCDAGRLQQRRPSACTVNAWWRWRWRNVVVMWFGSQMKMSLASEFTSTTWQRSDGKAAVYLTEWNLGAFLTHSRRLSMTSKESDACGTPVCTQHAQPQHVRVHCTPCVVSR